MKCIRFCRTDKLTFGSSYRRYGRSLGSGPTTHLAVKQSNLEQPVAGVILQSPVLSMFRVVFNFRYTFPGDLFCNIDVIDKVRSPVTIIHGTRDEVVPFWHGEGLFEMCPQGGGANRCGSPMLAITTLKHI